MNLVGLMDRHAEDSQPRKKGQKGLPPVVASAQNQRRLGAVVVTEINANGCFTAVLRPSERSLACAELPDMDALLSKAIRVFNANHNVFVFAGLELRVTKQYAPAPTKPATAAPTPAQKENGQKKKSVRVVLPTTTAEEEDSGMGTMHIAIIAMTVLIMLFSVLVITQKNRKNKKRKVTQAKALYAMQDYSMHNKASFQAAQPQVAHAAQPRNMDVSFQEPSTMQSPLADRGGGLNRYSSTSMNEWGFEGLAQHLAETSFDPDLNTSTYISIEPHGMHPGGAALFHALTLPFFKGVVYPRWLERARSLSVSLSLLIAYSCLRGIIGWS